MAQARKNDDVDRVASVSYRADGTPDQTPGFEVLTEDASQAPATAPASKPSK